MLQRQKITNAIIDTINKKMGNIPTNETDLVPNGYCSNEEVSFKDVPEWLHGDLIGNRNIRNHREQRLHILKKQLILANKTRTKLLNQIESEKVKVFLENSISDDKTNKVYNLESNTKLKATESFINFLYGKIKESQDELSKSKKHWKHYSRN